MRKRRGFTLIEVVIAAFLLTVAVLGLAALIPTVSSLTETVEESNLALASSHQLAESIRQYADDSYAYVWRAYNSLASDDPNGSGTAPGNTFAVPGLLDASGADQVGTVTFYIDETGTVDEVGLPKDLNGNGDALDTDVSGSYALLPFRIAVDWKDHRGNLRHTEIYSQVADY